ncbi:putative cytoplasm to vacuole targeting Vps64 [Talaromyces proteolyticus]|uniref:Cytoplasm to vacuole targeting Vps64 n=1 Tax=Talaromyces proteolyticus TaxID=1131652 RepID=A0AAD4PV37_9EURO|nr:putative cytoplasm to vacuole targeting Vps64 [Talaromyces proteolyticus]KAH8692954.1 putative cytoplasm to vacuole targeting Vps64 [Talaromyces proteolyticus]
MTAVASPPSVQSGPRLGWYSTGNAGQAALGSMNTEDVSRMFMPRKGVQRTNSSSSLSSNSSTTSTSTVTHVGNGATSNGTPAATWSSKKKNSRGLWPASKSEPVSGVTNARSQPVSSSTSVNGGPTASSAMSAIHQPSPVVPSQHMIQSPQQNGVNAGAVMQGSSDPPAILTLIPVNGTFEKKQINVPYFPEVLRIGRQTNAKTVPTPINGYFDSKVLSRQHAEIWADRRGKIWIRDVKSSNGTFVNGQRLSPESRESEPHELRENDSLELGIDIVSEDQKSIVHHKVSAKIEHAGVYGTGPNILDLNFGDIDPASGGGLMPSPLAQPLWHLRGRSSSSASNRSVQSAASSQINALHQQRQMNYYMSPMTIEQVVKKLTTEMKLAKQHSQDLRQTDEFLHTLITSDNSEKEKLLNKQDNISRHANGRPKVSRLDPISRFSDPPAPPPQQPLPEKPDAARRPSQEPHVGSLKRSDTEKPHKTGSASNSPVSRESSQIISLIEALSITKKELEAQNTRVKELEDLLRQERSARESAEEKARQSRALPESEVETASETLDDDSGEDVHEVEEITKSHENPQVNGLLDTTETENVEHLVQDVQTEKLQQKLNNMVTEIAEMKQQVETFKQRAEKAEDDTVEARKSLAEMIDSIKREREMQANETLSRDASFSESHIITKAGDKISILDSDAHHGIDPQNLKEFENAVTAMTQKRRQHLLENSTPYASMLGVVLLGVGLMAYLNGWQKVDR